MHDKNNQSVESNTVLEDMLARLEPLPAKVNRDGLMYQAGWQAGLKSIQRGRNQTMWKAATGLMTAACAAMALVLAGQSEQSPAVAQAGQSAAEVHTQKAETTATSVVANDSLGDLTETTSSAVVSRVLPGEWRASNIWRIGNPATNYLALRQVMLVRGAEDWPVQYREKSTADDNTLPPSIGARKLLEQMLDQATQPATRPSDSPPVGRHRSTKEQTV